MSCRLIPLLLSLLLLACQPHDHGQHSHAESAQAQPELAEAELGVFELEQYRGQVVYLDFWASWCPPCLESFPWMNTLHKELAEQGLTIVAVNVDANQQAAQAFLKKTPAEFELVFDPLGMISEQFNVTAMPSSFLYDRQGQLVASYQGFNPAKAASTRAEIEALLAQNATK